MTPAMNSTRRLSARAVALIGTGAVVAYALLAAVQILVWNPQAAVPGVGLDQIYADVAATGESMAAGMVIAFLAVGPLLAIALLVGAWRRPEGRASVVGVPFLVLLALGAPAYFWANFGPGMALADTFFVSGGDHSAWSAPLYVTSGLAVLALVGHVVWNRSSRQWDCQRNGGWRSGPTRRGGPVRKAGCRERHDDSCDESKEGGPGFGGRAVDRAGPC